MRAQVFASVIVGLAVSSALFLPLVLWQFRRYGRFDGLRILWTAAGFTYATGLVAFTVFPLPRFEPGYCADHATEPLLDPCVSRARCSRCSRPEVRRLWPATG